MEVLRGRTTIIKLLSHICWEQLGRASKHDTIQAQGEELLFDTFDILIWNGTVWMLDNQIDSFGFGLFNWLSIEL